MKTAFMPYNYTYAKQAHDIGVPMIRALVLEYPEDPFTWGNQTQYEYMWGENLLVAPVYQDTQMDENGNDVRNNIYLPDKDQIWIDYFTGEQYQGGQVINNFDAPLWKLPLFVKNGAILPKDVENNSQLFLNGDEDRIFEVYPAGTTTFDLYDDDGMSQDYKEGLGTMTHITSEAPEAGEKGTAVITVGKMSGTFEGMKSERGTQFIVNVSEKPETVTATIGGEEVTLKEVSSEAEFNEGTNVYYYNEAPDLNHYATEGSPFADQKIITTPKVMVKLAKTDITANEVKLTVEGFVNAQEKAVNPDDPQLDAADVPIMEAETTDSSITLQGTNLKDVYAFGLRLPIDMESINVSTITTTAAEATADMRNLSRMLQNDDEYTVAFSMEGDTEGLNGTMSLATIRVSATVDTELDLSMADAFVVSDGLDLRTALPGSTVSGNVSQLEDVIHAFTLETAGYASDSLSAFNDALTNAKNVLNDASATQETMNAAMKDLFNATLDIQRSEPTRVAALQKVIDVHSEEAVKKDYTTSDLDKILATVSNAQSTVYYDNTPVSIDTAFASVVERLMSTEDASGSLQTSKDLIVDAMSAIVDELTDTYTAESLTALKQASDAFAAESAFDASGIVTGFNQLEVQVHTDTQILETMINAAKAMNLESYDTESAEAALKTLREAEELLGAEPTQAQVDEMLQKLVNAITNVMKTEVEAARDALQALISEAEAIDLSHKTTASREAFAQALEDAKAVLADENADAQALDEAYRNLQAAINGLQDIVDSDKSALEQAIADAKKVNTSLYTKETVDVFEQALKEAEAVMVDETATQDQVDAAAKKLIAAQNALQKNPETPADPQDPDEGKPGEGTDSDTAAASALPTTAAALIVSGAAAALMLRKRKHHI